MSDPVLIAVIAAIVTPVVNLMVSIVLMVMQGRNIRRIEHHTNSITEQLVKVTRSDALREGREDERKKQSVELDQEDHARESKSE